MRPTTTSQKNLPNSPISITAGSTDETVINITDDDDPAVTVRFEQDSYTVAEGDNVIIKVILSADPERTVSIQLNRANQGGATDQGDTGADYSRRSRRSRLQQGRDPEDVHLQRSG